MSKAKKLCDLLVLGLQGSVIGVAGIILLALMIVLSPIIAIFACPK